jgi:hypothetical protein
MAAKPLEELNALLSAHNIEAVVTKRPSTPTDDNIPF